MQESTPAKAKIVIIGNGFGGTYTLKHLHKFFCGDASVHISLIGQKNYFLFTPLLHEVATGSINPENIVEPIRKVLGCCLSDFYLGRAEEINLQTKTVRVGNNTLSYDYLVLAAGSETNFYNVPGARENSFVLKSIEDAIKIKNHIIGQMEKAVHMEPGDARKKTLSFAVVGGGPTGVELATEIQELIQESFSRYYHKDLINDSSVVLIHKDSEILPQFGKKIRTKSLEFLTKKGIRVLLNAEVKEVGHNYIITDAQKIEAQTIVWVAGIKPVEIKFSDAVEKTQDGRILVNECLQLEYHPEIFALGDNAAFKVKDSDKFLPAMAQVASKQAKAAAKNIYLALKNKKPEPFKYRHSGNLVSLGQWMAIGEISKFTFWGHITWWLWRTVYLSKLISTRKKLKVAMDWTVNLFSPRDISEF